MKKYLANFLVLVLALSCCLPGVLALESSEAEWAYLNVADAGYRIYAPKVEILRYINAEEDSQKEALLAELLEDSNNQVSELTNMPFVEADEITENGLVEENSFAKSPVLVHFTNQTIPSGMIYSYGRVSSSGSVIPFDIAYDESFHAYVVLSSNRWIGTDVRLAGDTSHAWSEGNDRIWDEYWSNLSSGQYYFYFFNMDSLDANIMSGYMEVVSK